MNRSVMVSFLYNQTKEGNDSMSDTIDEFVSVAELAARIRNETVTPTDAVEMYLTRIEEVDGEINAFTTVNEEEALEAAHEAEEALEAGEDVGPLHGVPIALKDLGFRREGVVTTAGSEIMAKIGPPASDTAAVVERLKEAGAIFIGRTNVPELGFEGITDNDLHGPTASPVDTDYNSGGSSGGSAAAIGSGMAPAATGSDMGGSIRIPAAACGVFGHKPTYGLVPKEDRPNAFNEHTHHVAYGPITRTVEDAAILMDVMAGKHPRDPASVPVDIDYRSAVDQPVEELNVAYSPDLEAYDVDEEVAAVTGEAIEAISTAGATVTEVAIDHGLSMEELGDTLMTTTASMAYHGFNVFEQATGAPVAEYEDQMSDTIQTLVDFGREMDDSAEAKADLVRTQVYDAVVDVFEEYDLLVTSTLATAGFELSPNTAEMERAEQYMTWPFNWTGHPAASVPAGTTDAGLPVGMQLVAPRFDDDVVLAAAAAVERERPWDALYR